MPNEVACCGIDIGNGKEASGGVLHFHHPLRHM